MRKKRIVLVVIVAVCVGGACGFYFWRTHNISLVQHGYDEAMEHGCFTCHGLGGMNGVKNPGSRTKTVPVWGGGMHMMLIKEEKEIREWIEDGAPARLRNNKDWQAEQAKQLIHMPAYRNQLDEDDLMAIIAYYKAVAMYDSISDEAADQGRDEAFSMGCFNCHGPEGRGCIPNAGALKGYIPSWDGGDFPDLVQNDAELKEWILDGTAKRLTQNRFAAFFLQREKVQMPAYRGIISAEQLQKLMAYIKWLRSKPEEKSETTVKGAKQ